MWLDKLYQIDAALMHHITRIQLKGEEPTIVL